MENSEHTDGLSQVFASYVRLKGGRFTPERSAIASAIQQCDTHFSLDTLKAYLDKERFLVSRATLYNTLNELVEAGFLARFQVQEKTMYEIVYQRAIHSHQICNLCGRISEFQNTELDALVRTQKYKRFTMECYTLMVYGICTSCKAQLKRASKKEKLKNI